jgi:hypothetical protein
VPGGLHPDLQQAQRGEIERSLLFDYSLLESLSAHGIEADKQGVGRR